MMMTTTPSPDIIGGGSANHHHRHQELFDQYEHQQHTISSSIIPSSLNNNQVHTFINDPNDWKLKLASGQLGDEDLINKHIDSDDDDESLYSEHQLTMDDDSDDDAFFGGRQRNSQNVITHRGSTHDLDSSSSEEEDVYDYSVHYNNNNNSNEQHLRSIGTNNNNHNSSGTNITSYNNNNNSNNSIGSNNSSGSSFKSPRKKRSFRMGQDEEDYDSPSFKHVNSIRMNHPFYQKYGGDVATGEESGLVQQQQPIIQQQSIPLSPPSPVNPSVIVDSINTTTNNHHNNTTVDHLPIMIPQDQGDDELKSAESTSLNDISSSSAAATTIPLIAAETTTTTSLKQQSPTTLTTEVEVITTSNTTNNNSNTTANNDNNNSENYNHLFEIITTTTDNNNSTTTTTVQYSIPPPPPPTTTTAAIVTVSSSDSSNPVTASPIIDNPYSSENDNNYALQQALKYSTTIFDNSTEYIDDPFSRMESPFANGGPKKSIVDPSTRVQPAQKKRVRFAESVIMFPITYISVSPREEKHVQNNNNSTTQNNQQVPQQQQFSIVTTISSPVVPSSSTPPANNTNTTTPKTTSSTTNNNNNNSTTTTTNTTNTTTNTTNGKGFTTTPQSSSSSTSIPSKKENTSGTTQQKSVSFTDDSSTQQEKDDNTIPSKFSKKEDDENNDEFPNDNNNEDDEFRTNDGKRRVWGLTGYQYLVLASAWLGWAFDIFDGVLFSYAAPICIPNLLGYPDDQITSTAAKEQTALWTSILSTVLLFGWGCGGVFFGWLTDKVGRSKTMMITIIVYSIGTFLAAFSFHISVLVILRFVASLGIGGEWSAGAALISETLPIEKRVIGGVILYTAAPIGSMASFAVNYLITSVLLQTTTTPVMNGTITNSTMLISSGVMSGDIGAPVVTGGPIPLWLSWRILFAIGVVPTIVGIFVRLCVKEPDAWLEQKKREKEEEEEENNLERTEGAEALPQTPPRNNHHGGSSTVTASPAAFETMKNSDSISLTDEDDLREVDLNNDQPVMAVTRSESEFSTTSSTPFKKKKKGSSYLDLFSNADLRKKTISAILFVCPALISWWCISTFIPILSTHLASPVQDATERKNIQNQYSVLGNMLFNFGGLIGTLLVIPIAMKLGRLWVYRIYFFCSTIFIIIAFGIPDLSPYVRFCLMFPVGLFVFGAFGSFTFYLPELFPLELRGRGAGFTYNCGRFGTAIFPFIVGVMVSQGVNPLIVLACLSIATACGFIVSVIPKFAVETKNLVIH